MINNLTFIEQVDSFFSELFKNLKNIITWQTLGILITGIIIGFILCSTIYGILLLKSVNKKEKELNNYQPEITNDEIKIIVEDVKQNYIETTEGMPYKERFATLGSKIVEIANRIAGKYYPESKYPLYELSIEELISLINYLSNRVEQIFDKGILVPFKKISISQIFRILDKKKEIDENKAVKVLKKAKVGKVKKIVMTTLKIINPITWLKKLVVNSTISFAMRKMSIIVIDIVATETNNVYSKKIFNKENKLQEAEIQKLLEELDKEELDA